MKEDIFNEDEFWAEAFGDELPRRTRDSNSKSSKRNDVRHYAHSEMDVLMNNIISAGKRNGLIPTK